MKKIITSLALAVLTTTAYAQNKTLEERVEDLELSRDLNWIKWGGSLETRYDYASQSREKDYTTTSSTGVTQNFTKGGDNDNTYRLWANLNMEATPNDRLSFFGRLSAAKYFTVLGTDGEQSTAFADLGDGQNPRNSSLFLERAFVNYKIKDNLVFTMGRLPTIDGPNKHVALNQQLSGNYPTLAYSAILDGFALTHSMKPETDSVFRTKLIYTPTSTLNNSGRTANGSDQLRNADGKRLRTTSNFYSLLAEYEKMNTKFFRKNLTIFQWLRGDQNPFHQTPATTTIAAGNTVTTGSNLEVSVDRFVLYSEFEKIFNSDFDFALQGMYSHTRSRGSLTSCTSSTGGAGGVVCSGLNADDAAKGWSTNKRSDSLDGFAHALTLRYQTPWKALNRPKVGVEWFQATKEAYVYDAANINPINMYATQGGSGVYHAFWNQQFDGGLAMNVGYMYRQQRMTREVFGVFGDEVKTNNIDQNIYVSLLATF